MEPAPEGFKAAMDAVMAEHARDVLGIAPLEVWGLKVVVDEQLRGRSTPSASPREPS